MSVAIAALVIFLLAIGSTFTYRQIEHQRDRLNEFAQQAKDAEKQRADADMRQRREAELAAAAQAEAERTLARAASAEQQRLAGDSAATIAQAGSDAVVDLIHPAPSVRLDSATPPPPPVVSAAPPTTSITLSASLQGANAPAIQISKIDLIKLIDPSRDAVAGTWKLDNNALSGSATGEAHNRLSPPVDWDGEYTLTVRFIRTSGQTDIDVFFPVGTSQAKLGLCNIFSNRRATGLESIRDKTAPFGNATVPNPSILNGREYSLEIHVIPDAAGAVQIETRLDGKPLLTWTGLQSSLRNLEIWRLPKGHRFGFGVYDDAVTFTSAKWEGDARSFRHLAPSPR